MSKTKKTNFNAISAFCCVSSFLTNADDKYIHRLIQATDCPLESEAQKSEASGTDSWLDFLENFLQLTGFLHLTQVECLVFSALYTVQIRMNSAVSWNDLCSFLSIDPVVNLPLRSTLSDLAKRGYLNCANGNVELTFKRYKVDNSVETAMQNNRFDKKKNELMDRYQFCGCMSEVFDVARWDRTNNLFPWVEKMEAQHKSLPLVCRLKELGLSADERVVFYLICDDFLNTDSRNTHLFSTLSTIYGGAAGCMKALSKFLYGQHPLQGANLVRVGKSRGAENATAMLTENGRRLFLEEDYDLFRPKYDKESTIGFVA